MLSAKFLKALWILAILFHEIHEATSKLIFGQMRYFFYQLFTFMCQMRLSKMKNQK